MSIHRALISFGALVFAGVLATACSGAPASASSPGNAAPPGDAAACSQHVSAAQKKLQAVLDANRACSKDADCESVAFGAGCFDSCTRTIAVSGKAAYEAAAGAVNKDECKAYKDAGCPSVMPPPCAPPLAPRCNAGKCE
jgi:hypothetical protein